MSYPEGYKSSRSQPQTKIEPSKLTENEVWFGAKVSAQRKQNANWDNRDANEGASGIRFSNKTPNCRWWSSNPDKCQSQPISFSMCTIQSNALMTGGLGEKNKQWLLDSGTTGTMTSDKNDLA